MHPVDQEYLRNYQQLVNSYNSLSRKNSFLIKDNSCLLTKIKTIERILEENRIR